MDNGPTVRPLARGTGAGQSDASEVRCPRVLKRRAILAALVAFVAGCGAQGKFARRLAFEVPDESLIALASALRDFAAREVFKFHVSETGPDRFFLLVGDDIDITFAPHAPGDMPISLEPAPEEEAAPAEAAADVDESMPSSPPSPQPPPHVSPARYEAWFFVHTSNGFAPQLDALAHRFSTTISSIEGIRKMPLHSPT